MLSTEFVGRKNLNAPFFRPPLASPGIISWLIVVWVNGSFQLQPLPENKALEGISLQV